MAETLKDYLVGIKFNVDQAGAGRANQTVSELDAITQKLGEVLMQAAEAFQGLIAQAKSGNNAIKDTSNSMKKGSDSAKKLAQNLKSANKEGKLSGLKQGKKHVNELDHTMRKAASTLKKYLKLAAGYLVGNGILSTFKGVMEFNEGLAKSAKELKKTVEQTRAYNLALQVMGKTAKEIEQDKSLKATFENLQKIGNSLALPEAAAGIRNIGAVKDSLMELKMVGSYALQWIYYKLQEVAAGPLAETRKILGSIRDWFSGNIKNIAEGVGKAFKWVLQIINSVVKAFGMVLNFIHGLPDSVKWAVGIIATLILGLKSKAFRTFGILGLILLLLDDFITYLEGGDALFGDFWQGCIDGYNKYVKPIIDTAIEKFDEFIQNVTKAWNESSDFGDFIKRLVMGEDYVVNETTWKDVGKKIWEAIKSGIKQTGDWLKTILGYEVTDDWKTIGKDIGKKIDAGITEAAKGLDEALGTGGTFFGIWEGLKNAVVAIADALKDAGPVIDTVISLVNKAAEMGILGDAIKGIAIALIAIKAAKVVAPLFSIFKILGSGVGVVAKVASGIGTLFTKLGLGKAVLSLVTNPIFLLISALGLLTYGILKVTGAWDRMMHGISESESNQWGLDNLRLVYSDINQGFNVSGKNFDSTDAFKEVFGQSLSEYMAEYIKENATFNEAAKAALLGIDDQGWFDVIKGNKDISSFVDVNAKDSNEAADTGEVDLEAYMKAVQDLQQQTGEASGESMDGLLAGLQEQGEQAQSTAEDMGILNMSLEEFMTLLDSDSESFSSLGESAKNSMNAAAGSVRAGVNRIKTSLGSIPKDITINVKTAFRSAGLTLPGYTSALSMLNGKAEGSATPGYVFGNMGAGDTNNEKNVNISAPATFNVYGSDAKAAAAQAARINTNLTIRNAKSAIG